MASNDRILVSVPEMEAAINKYEDARSTLQDSFNRLEAAKNHLDNCYKGPAYLALCARWQVIYANVKTAENAVQAAVTGLQNTIAQMTDVEAEVKADGGKLETGTSSPVYL